MPGTIDKPALLDDVWAEVCDSRWYTLREISKRVRSSDDKIALAVKFLKKYGFAQVSAGGKFRIYPGSPSPMEIAFRLRSFLDFDN